MSKSLQQKHKLSDDSKDSKQAGDLAEKITAFVPEIENLEYKLGELKHDDHDKMLEELMDSLKKYIKVGKMWETAEKARIAEEREIKKTMDQATTATDVLHDILKSTLDSINPVEKPIKHQDTIDKLQDMLDHHGEDEEMHDTIDQLKKVVKKHHEKTEKAFKKAKKVKEDKKEKDESDDEDDIEDSQKDEKDTKEILKLNKKLKTKAIEKKEAEKEVKEIKEEATVKVKEAKKEVAKKQE